ncbi:DUF4158 domain-containing protein [Nocardia sp. KC 131]
MRQEWSTEDLIGSWTLVGEDWRLVGNKSGATRLGFSLLLKFFELGGRFPTGPEELPAAAVAYMADQVKVDPALLDTYRWSGSTIEYHRAHINTRLFQAVLENAEFHDLIGDNERRAMSPLFWSNINPYGRFRLDMDTRLDLSREHVAG